jgi:hypothetical protein
MHLGLAAVVLAPVVAARAIPVLATPMRSCIAIAITAALAAILAVRTPPVGTAAAGAASLGVDGGGVAAAWRPPPRWRLRCSRRSGRRSPR